MDTYLDTRLKKVGQMPGSLIYTGPARSAPVTVRLMQYGPDGPSDTLNLSASEAPGRLKAQGVNWVDVDGVHDVALLAELGEAFKLHPLTLEDIASIGQRPKVEFYDDYLYLVLRMLTLNEAGELENEQVSMILGPNYLLTFQETPGDVFDGVRERIRQKKGRICRLGSDYLAYSLLDAVVDTYFTLLEGYSDRLERLEARVYDNPRPEVMAAMNGLKRDTLFVRKAVWPLRDLMSALQREESPLISSAVLTFLRDAQDHSVQIIETVEALREILSSLHDTYLSSLSHRMNEVMKTLTIVGVIFIPLTFLVGVYGMNFEVMPELHWPWAYPALWLIMIALALGMLAYFRRRGWL